MRPIDGGVRCEDKEKNAVNVDENSRRDGGHFGENFSEALMIQEITKDYDGRST